MLPPSHTFRPAASCIRAMSVVVVVLPSEPVTAITWQGHRAIKTSISLVTTTPSAAAAASSGRVGRTLGVRKITSPPRPSK